MFSVMKAPTIDEYIESKARELTTRDFARLPQLLDQCRAKAGNIPTGRHPRLAAQIEVMASLLESESRARASERECRRELAVGAFYVVKGVDCIPDTVPDIGYADDARLLDRIFSRNREAILRAAEGNPLAEQLPQALP